MLLDTNAVRRQNSVRELRTPFDREEAPDGIDGAAEAAVATVAG
jgi:hypothetical protein